MRAVTSWAVFVLAACSLSGCSEPSGPEPQADTGTGEAEASAEDDVTSAVMREIFAGIRVALPTSVDREAFRAPQNHAAISAALDKLARNAALLEQHASSEDAQLQFLAQSVSRDANEVWTAFEHGRYDRAAYVLRQIVEDCVVCHTRLPASEDSTLTEGFVDSGVMGSLPLEPRATLLTATRRFDEALDALEALLADPATHPAIMLGPLTDYLVISIRVKGDYERPAPTLEKFARRDDLWPSLRSDVEQWRRSLPQLRESAASAPRLAEVRELVQRDALDVERGDGQSGLLRAIVASSILEKFISAHRTRDAELGEAFYHLGMLEARIGRNYWLTRAPFLLEESIRIAPNQDFAREALAVLERELFAVYEGSDIEVLPSEEAARITELRALTRERSRPRGGPDTQ